MSSVRIFPACFLPVTLAAIAPLGTAQTVVFHEDFETGLGEWTATGLWNAESSAGVCGSQAPAFPVGSGAAYWGRDLFCDFNSGTWAGDLIMPAPVHLPDTFTSARLKFWTYEDVECDVCGWDWRFVYVSTDDGVTWDFVGEGDTLWEWYEKSIDLSPYIGEDVLIRFHFDAVDHISNGGLGWLIDDIMIEVDCTTPANYCEGLPNSVGPGAVMGWSGSQSVAANDFHITVSGAPPGHHGTFFYGFFQTQFPFGDGVRCISGFGGILRLSPSMVTDATGSLSRHVDFTLPPANAGAGMIEAGDAWNFQFFYRDQVPGGAGFNLSDGLRMGFCP